MNDATRSTQHHSTPTSEVNMTSKKNRKAVPSKPLPDNLTPRAHPPNPPRLISGFIESDHNASYLNYSSSSPTASHRRASTAAVSPELSLQEYQRQHGGGQNLDEGEEEEASSDMIPQELEGSFPLPITKRVKPPPSPSFDHSNQPSSPVLILPPPELPQSYFIMDTDTGMAYYPTAQALPISKPLSPPSISASYDIQGVPVITSNNPADHAREVIKQRYTQEFQGMTQVGEELIRRIVDLDVERERRRFERLVWSGAADAELVGFAEWLMRGEE